MIHIHFCTRRHGHLPSVKGKTKRCQKCREFLPFSHFGRNRATPDGLQYQCNLCRSVSRRKTEKIMETQTTFRTVVREERPHQ